MSSPRRSLLRRLFLPEFAGEDVRQAQLLHFATLIIGVLTIIVSQSSILTGRASPAVHAGWIGAIGACLLAQWLLRRGRIQLAAAAVVGIVWLLVTHRIAVTGGTSSIIVAAYFPIALLATVVSSTRAGLFTGLLSVLMLLGFRLLERWDALPEPESLYQPGIAWVIRAAAMMMTVGLAHRAMVLLDRGLKRARESEASLAELIESAPEGIVALDSELRVIALNPAAERILGEDVHSEDHDDFTKLGWDDPEAVRRMMGPEAEDSPHLRGLVVFYERDAEQRELELVARAINPSAGSDSAARWRLSVRDITQRRTAERQRDDLVSQLHQAQRLESLGLLAGGIAHDFNNLTTIVVANAELLNEELGDTPNGEIAREIGMAGSRAAELTRQLLAFGRKQVLQPRPLVLCDAVAELVPMLRRLIPASIELSFEPAGTDVVRVDPGQLSQVLVNLVVNGRDAMAAEGGTLRIAVESPPEQTPVGEVRRVTLSVGDTGHGMGEATVRRVFEPFFTTKRQGEGTGLGLAVVEGIIAQSDGEIRVQSELGTGTTFSIELPTIDGHELEGPTSERRSFDDLERATVLLVEDDKLVRVAVRRILERAGYQVIVASDGEAALEEASRHPGPIEILLTDVVMPKLGGVELAAELRRRREDLRVVFMSGYTAGAFGPEGSPAGTYFVGKPMKPQKLLDVLSSLPRKAPTVRASAQAE